MTPPASSLQRRLTGAVIAVVGVALAALSAAESFESERRAWERFDERLVQEARRAAAAVRVQPDGTWSLPDGALARLDQSRGSTAYHLWGRDAALLARFPAEAAPLPPPPAGAAWSIARVTLPGGRARVLRAWLEAPALPAGSPRVAVAVARDVDVIEARISRQRAVRWGATLAVVVLAAAVSALVVRRSLRPVARLSAGIASIDAGSLARRLDLEGLPSELVPPFAKLNELLSRLEIALERERQFSADVSHELRTPIAGVRAILEVSAARERPGPEYRRDLGEALEVVGQLESIVENLLALARLGAGQAPSEAAREPVALRELVEACITSHAEKAHRRGLRIEDGIPPGLELSSDPVNLRLIVANLLGNAVEYTEEGGWIALESDPARGLVLAVRDSGPRLPGDALERIFDPFFRLDAARSGGGEHAGVGLALVRALCESLGWRVEASNDPARGVTFAVTAPPSREAGQAPDPRAAAAPGPPGRA